MEEETSQLDSMMDDILSGMDEADRELTRPILEQYVWLTSKANDMMELINEQGSVIEVECGGPNNRHIELKKNPAADILCKYTTQSGGHYTKLKRFLKEPEKLDDLDAFIKG